MAYSTVQAYSMVRSLGNMCKARMVLKNVKKEFNNLVRMSL